MEAEISDLLDRKMMNLYGLRHDKFDKVDATNTTTLTKDKKSRMNSPEPETLNETILPSVDDGKLKRTMYSTDAKINEARHNASFEFTAR